MALSSVVFWHQGIPGLMPFIIFMPIALLEMNVFFGALFLIQTQHAGT
jgi:hypothetical protein